MSISEFMNLERIFQMKNFDRDGMQEKFVTNHKHRHLKLPENPENIADLSTLKRLEHWKNSRYLEKLTLDENYMIKTQYESNINESRLFLDN